MPTEASADRADLVTNYLLSRSYAETTRRAKDAWLRAWETLIGKPLAEANMEDVLKLKREFSTHRGWVPLKYAQTLKGFYAWLAKVTPGFIDPTAGVEFAAGEEPALKGALRKEDMVGILGQLEQDARVSPYREGPDVIKQGNRTYSLKRYLWYWTLRIGPVFLFRAHELLPYKPCHPIVITNQETYEVSCRSCNFKARYWPREGALVDVLVDDSRHIPNEKLAHFRFGTAVDSSGREWVTATFPRKGKVRRNRTTGTVVSEVHWSDPKPLDREMLHWLRLILLAPPKTAKGATGTLNAIGERFGLRLTNSKGEPIKLTFHIWSKHSAVTLGKEAGLHDDEIAARADVSEVSLRPYKHMAGRAGEISRMVQTTKSLWGSGSKP